jgi:hypothetical protein
MLACSISSSLVRVALAVPPDAPGSTFLKRWMQGMRTHNQVAGAAIGPRARASRACCGGQGAVRWCCRLLTT